MVLANRTHSAASDAQYDPTRKSLLINSYGTILTLFWIGIIQRSLDINKPIIFVSTWVKAIYGLWEDNSLIPTITEIIDWIHLVSYERSLLETGDKEPDDITSSSQVQVLLPKIWMLDCSINDKPWFLFNKISQHLEEIHPRYSIFTVIYSRFFADTIVIGYDLGTSRLWYSFRIGFPSSSMPSPQVQVVLKLILYSQLRKNCSALGLPTHPLVHCKFDSVPRKQRYWSWKSPS